MSASGSLAPAIGFLSVIEHDDHGYFGGYLVLNTAGRPLEFHCTAPVRPNKAQQILYGPTLKPYVYGEQIGQTLVAKANHQPLVICIDVQPAIGVRDFVTAPVAYVVSEADVTSSLPMGQSSVDSLDARVAGSTSVLRVDPSQPRPNQLVRFKLAGNELAIAAKHSSDQDKIIEYWQTHIEHFDLQEPFGRIHDAIDEAQKAAAR